MKKDWLIADWLVAFAEKMKHAPGAGTQVAQIKNGASTLTAVKKKARTAVGSAASFPAVVCTKK